MSKANTDKLTFRKFLATSRTFKKDFYLSLLIPLNAICLYTALPFIIGKILAELAAPTGINISTYVAAFIIVGLIGVISNVIGFGHFFRLQAKVMAELQQSCLDMLLRRGMTYHNNQVSGKVVSDAVDYPGSYNQLSGTIMTTMIPFAITLVSGLTVLFILAPLLGLLMLATSAVAIGSGVLQRNKMRPYRKKRIAASKAVTAHVADTIVNASTVKTFAREQAESTRGQELGATLKLRRTHDWSMFATQGASRISFLLVFQLAFVLLIIWLVRRDPSVLAAGIFAFSYTVTLTNRLFEIGNIMRSMEEAYLLAEPMTLALQEKVEVVDSPDATTLKVSKGTVAFEAVNFSYHDRSDAEPVFENLQITIKPGEKVGLVGPSGGGKSTITKLLLRFEDIQAGTISIDGQNIATVTQTSLRKHIAYVPQESLLFHRTIKENIAYGLADASDKAIIQAAKDASADGFIKQLPEGYETVVGERGVKLSGGQRQRVAIARAILKDAPILVLDEATSALDSESEQAIQEALWKLMQHRTALVIAHRLSTIQRMDRILVLADGKIVEDGSHTDLVRQNGLYARLWNRQSGGFIED